MEIIFLLLPIALVLASFGIWAFFWSVNNGQFEDLESPAHSILFEDDEHLIPTDAKQDKTTKSAASPASEQNNT